MSDGAIVAKAAQRKSSAQLREIARLLGQPEDMFFDRGKGADEYGDAFELLQLWNGLMGAADRQKLLNFARTLVADRN